MKALLKSQPHVCADQINSETSIIIVQNESRVNGKVTIADAFHRVANHRNESFLMRILCVSVTLRKPAPLKG